MTGVSPFKLNGAHGVRGTTTGSVGCGIHSGSPALGNVQSESLLLHLAARLVEE